MRRTSVAMTMVGVVLCARAAAAQDVVGGEPVPDGVWEDVAAVYTAHGFICSGVLVAPDVVLTASHCTGNIAYVKVGVNDTREEGETIDVVRQIRYSERWWESYDIAVLILARESTVKPRMIATGCVSQQLLADGADVALVGFGAVDEQGGVLLPELREAFTVITDHDCSPVQHGCNSAISPNGELGAGGDGIDTCLGDSGGPLYLLGAGEAFLAGITSRGYSDSTVPCSQGGIYTRPDAVFDWIEEVSGRSLERPNCDILMQAPAPSYGCRASSARDGLTGALLLLGLFGLAAGRARARQRS